MSRVGLRSALLLPVLVTLLVGSIALGLFVHRAVEQDLLDSLDDQVERALLTNMDDRGPGGPSEPESGPLQPPAVAEAERPVIVSIGPDGAVDTAGLDDGESVDVFLDVEPMAPTTLDGDQRYRVAAATQPNGTLVIAALPMDSVDQSLASLRRNLVVGVIALVAIEALVVTIVARRTTRPVSRLRDTAHRIADGDLTADVEAVGGPRETTALAADLDRMLTRLRSTLAEQEAATREAERARADMERFMADAAHELRTPLTALRGYADLHAGGMLDEEGLDRAMSRIGGESQRLTELVNDLLTLVRPTTSRPERVDLGAIVSVVVHDLRVAHPDHHIAQEVCSTTPVCGDPARLHRAVLNLAANACHHTPPGTEVVLGVRDDGDAVILEVVDHGPGIDPGVAATLFQPFVRGDESRSRRSHDGAGLGLAMVARIAEQHGGSAAADDTPGGGATLWIRLPGADPTPNL